MILNAVRNVFVVKIESHEVGRTNVLVLCCTIHNNSGMAQDFGDTPERQCMQISLFVCYS
jgi:hypothetical protein